MNLVVPPPAVVLVRPREEGNVGAVARAMANFGLERLLLVEPATRLGSTAKALAMHAHHVLERAERHATFEQALAEFDVVVGTASLRERGWPDRVLTARELPEWLQAHGAGGRVALVFGPEVSGLTSEELVRSTVLVSIPCAKAQPTLNLAQSVLLVCYELFQHRPPEATSPARQPARRAPAQLLERVDRELIDLLRSAGFARDTTFLRVGKDLRRLLSRAQLSEREAMILGGIVRRTRRALERARRSGGGPGRSDNLPAE